MFKLDWYKDNKLSFEQVCIDDKMEQVLVYDQVKLMGQKVLEIKTENRRNILTLSNGYRLEIYRIDKNASLLDNYSMIGKNVAFYNKSGKLDNIKLVTSRYDEETEICQCFFIITDENNKKTYIMKTGYGMNHVFNTILLNKRVQIRVTDGAMRYRDIDINSL